MKIASVSRIALHDLARWRKMPLTAACALVPPIAMMLVLSTLSLAVTTQPVALVVQGTGPAALKMAQIIENDTDAYYLTVCNSTTANSLFANEQVAAVITIPANFTGAVANGTGKVTIKIDNTDFDFSDDLRRSIDRSIVEFNAQSLISNTDPTTGELVNSSATNPYHVGLVEYDLRQTTVDWFHYQLVPTFVLLTLNVGLVGTAMLCALDEDSKTARMLVLSPQRGWVLVAGRIMGGVLACVVTVVPAILFSILIGFVTVPVSQLPALAGIFLGTALCASGTGAIVGTSVKGTRYVAFLSSIIASYLFFLGGGFTAIEFVPKWLQTVSTLIPTSYSIDALRQALFYPNPVGVPLSLIVLGVYAAGCVAVGAAIMRRSWLRR
ncbi:MAG TPA: ABC transporter permease [Nitrososphaerales archaeon]|nr:ABC transporter permease [Nitrososphaerales archaeon]